MSQMLLQHGLTLLYIIAVGYALSRIVTKARGIHPKSWQDFADSLSTAGGTILVLLVLFVAMIPLVVHVMHHGDNPQVTTIILSTFTGIFSALMLALKSSASRQQMADRKDPQSSENSIITTQKTETIASTTTPTPGAPHT